MDIISIHPFPAKMAPELALIKTRELKTGSTVLDPMVGSGTVLQAAYRNGHRCIGFDIDPLAVLMTRVATSKIDERRFDQLIERLITAAKKVDLRTARLPWLDAETIAFVKYWFAPEQRRCLTRLAHVLHSGPSFSDGSPEANAVRITLSKLIITKDRGASLARDVSHSRPHRVMDGNNFDVFWELEIAAHRLRRRLVEAGSGKKPTINLGDARKLSRVRSCSVDMVMTSPPYLNAIDYMRGHRLSLIWFGHSLSQLRDIRANSIGAERGADLSAHSEDIGKVRKALGKIEQLSSRHNNIINRYSLDLVLLTQQISRVLTKSGRAVFVVGNSCIKDVFVSNARGLEVAARLAGLYLIEKSERKLPSSCRYLPIPSDHTSALGRRMRTESVLTFGAS